MLNNIKKIFSKTRKYISKNVVKIQRNYLIVFWIAIGKFEIHQKIVVTFILFDVSVIFH